jgi:chemotaxis protein MotB
MSRRRGGGGGHDAGMERWLLTYADMITLLLALFIVLWSISSVNISKFIELKKSLHSAFSGQVMSGSTAILSGGTAPLEQQGEPVTSIVPSPNVKQSIINSINTAADKQDTSNLQRIQQELDAYSKAHGLQSSIKTSIDERGLVIRVLTDDLLFDPGQATLNPASAPLLAHIARMVDADAMTNAIRVEGNTDDIPISTAQFPSNWQLSTGRADAVLTSLLGHGVKPARLSVAGYADQHPIASNATPEGRALNRRVEIVVLRRSQGSLTS